MAKNVLCLCIFGFLLEFFRGECIILVVPEDVPAGFAGIYGFSPRLMIGKDHRVGFGFSFGNHADFQIMYELGPQLITRPLQSNNRVRSASYRQSVVKKRPLLQFLINLGLVKKVSYNYDYNDNDNEIDMEPR